MNDLYLTLNFVIFQVMPYAILAILLLGSFARYLISPFSWKSQSSELIDKKDFDVGCKFVPHRCHHRVLRSRLRPLYTERNPRHDGNDSCRSPVG